ncbi:hypothetical protein ACFL4W_05125 [Planctomycetota bacterium]
MQKTFYCNCDRPYSPLGPNPGFNDMCESCNAYLHACINCKQYDQRNNNCTDPAADPVRMPDGKNYCEVFIPFESPSDGRAENPGSGKAKDNLGKLFGE